ncbi:MAG: 3-dehydroquinate synthase [Clostridiales bacterium]|nr:3-dehydroquinate synthase [Clostridiales bacterium]
MKRVLVNSKENPYYIYINDNFEYFIKLLKEYKLNKVVIVFDYNAYKFHGKQFIKLLEENEILQEKYILKSNEKNKNLNTVYDIYDFLYRAKVDRNAVLIAFGGGIIGDIVGFVASSYKRGIRFIQVPTTLLACIDSSIGGKVAVNFKDIKNLIGAFYNPLFVYENVTLLNTLEKREYNCGMVEIIKHALLADAEFFEQIESGNCKSLEEMIRKSVEIKAEIVEIDEKENGLRVILNLGHTVGHAIESVSKFRVSHGEAVALGILYSLKVSCELNKMSKKNAKRIEKLFKEIGVLPKNLKDLSARKIKKCIEQDKKMKDGILQYVILDDIGKYEILHMDKMKYFS